MLSRGTFQFESPGKRVAQCCLENWYRNGSETLPKLKTQKKPRAVKLWALVLTDGFDYAV